MNIEPNHQSRRIKEKKNIRGTEGPKPNYHTKSHKNTELTAATHDPHSYHSNLEYELAQMRLALC